MGKELIAYSHLDPEVILAVSNTLQLYDEYEACKDPWVKKILRGLVYDALKYEAEIELKSRVNEAMQMLHGLQKPDINPN